MDNTPVDPIEHTTDAVATTGEVATTAEVATAAADPLTAWIKEKSANGIEQGTAQWLEKKVGTVGGATLAVVQGKNQYKSMRSFVKEKINQREFTASLACDWGTLFEEVICRTTEHLFATEVLGSSMFIETDNDRIKYSPDGIAIMQRNREFTPEEQKKGKKAVPCAPAITPVPECALLEFKCPYSRLPNGRIPAEYYPQVMMGMDVVEPSTAGMYAEAVFRRSEFVDFDFTVRFTPIVAPTGFKAGATSSQKMPPGASVIAIGAVGFAKKIDVSGDTDMVAEEISRLSAHSDLGAAHSSLISELLRGFSGKTVHARFSQQLFAPGFHRGVFGGESAHPEDHPEVPSPAEMLTAFTAEHVEFCATNGLLNCGILPWKLVTYEYHWVKKEVGYVNRWLPQINAVLDTIEACKGKTGIERDRIIDELCGAEVEDCW